MILPFMHQNKLSYLCFACYGLIGLEWLRKRLIVSKIAWIFLSSLYFSLLYHLSDCCYIVWVQVLRTLCTFHKRVVVSWKKATNPSRHIMEQILSASLGVPQLIKLLFLFYFTILLAFLLIYLLFSAWIVRASLLIFSSLIEKRKITQIICTSISRFFCNKFLCWQPVIHLYY